MHASYREDRPATADADPDAMLRMRIAIADPAFVAKGITLGLLLKWAERAPPSDDLPPRPDSYYGWSKAAMESLGRLYLKLKDLSVQIRRTAQAHAAADADSSRRLVNAAGGENTTGGTSLSATLNTGTSTSASA